MEDTEKNEPMASEQFIESAIIVLTGIARTLVEHPEKVFVEVKNELGSVTLVLKVSPEDLEHIVGTGKRTERSLGAIVSAIMTKAGSKMDLDIQAVKPN